MPICYTRDEAAEILKVKPDTISLWIRQGKLRGSRIGGGKNVRVTEEAIKEFLAKTEVRKEQA